jgi:hypothetical protein
MATTVIARDFQSAQALYQRSLQGELMQVNREGQIRTATLGTRVVSALIGLFKGADALDAFRSQQQRQVAQAFKTLVDQQPAPAMLSAGGLRERSGSIDTLDGRDLSVPSSSPASATYVNVQVNATAENPYELPTDALAMQAGQVAKSPAQRPASPGDYEMAWDVKAARQNTFANPGYSDGSVDSDAYVPAATEDVGEYIAPATAEETHEAAVPQGIKPYAQAVAKGPLNYSTDPTLAHLKPTAHFVKAEIEQHGTDAGRALQNIGILKTLNNANQTSTGEILQALTPALQQAYEAELGRLKGERAERAVGQKAADAAYRAASLDNPNLPIHGLLNSPLFAQAPDARRVLENAYLDGIDKRHAMGATQYDPALPSHEVIANRSIQRDALMAEFGAGNRDSAFSRQLAALSLGEDQADALRNDFQDRLGPLAFSAVARGDLSQTTTDFAAQVNALAAQVLASAQP